MVADIVTGILNLEENPDFIATRKGIKDPKELPFEEPADGRLFEAVMRLPEKYRIVLHLFYYEDYSVEEIAGILHSRTGTVKSQLHRGRMLLKNQLMEEWNDDE